MEIYKALTITNCELDSLIAGSPFKGLVEVQQNIEQTETQIMERRDAIKIAINLFWLQNFLWERCSDDPFVVERILRGLKRLLLASHVVEEFWLDDFRALCQMRCGSMEALEKLLRLQAFVAGDATRTSHGNYCNPGTEL